jgi:phosphoserine phosphatase
VYANTLMFDDCGAYKGFDPAELTSSDGGKALAIADLQRRHGHDTVIMIGDGANDLLARPPASVLVGYGGTVVREIVKAAADWFIHDFQVSLPQ